jgi:hypothetical protein
MDKSCGVPLRSISDTAPSSVRTFFSPSAARGVGQPAYLICCASDDPVMFSVIEPARVESDADGVVQPDRCQDTTSTVLRLLSLFPAALLPFRAGVPAIGVGQPASIANTNSDNGLPRASSNRPARNSGEALALFQSRAAGVGHPIEPVSDVRSTDARRRERDRPDPVSQAFQVILYKVDPRICVLARNLLSKDNWRTALADEMVECRPEVPLVSKPSAFACRAERLARTGTSPNRSIV